MSDTPKWAEDIADSIISYLRDLDRGESASWRAIAGVIADHMEEAEVAEAYFKWLLEGHHNALWQAHQLSNWVKMNRDKVPESILLIAEAKP